MAAGGRLSIDERRNQLIDAGAALFAARSYDDVVMDHVAEKAGISRALLYRHFPAKRDLFAAVYQRAAEQLLAASDIDPTKPLTDQVAAGLDAHFDYFEQNRKTVLSANRTLAGDPTVQTIITDELTVLRQRMLAAAVRGDPKAVSSVLMGWLVFVRTLSVDWLATGSMSRTELRETCLGALLGALTPFAD